MRFFPLLAVAAIAGACGVSFSAAPQGNDFFKSLDVTGSPNAGAPLTARLSVKQTYRTDIDVRCELRQEKNLVKPLHEDRAAPNPDGSPKATAVPEHFTFDFSVDRPGAYVVECFTPADEDNFIDEPLQIR